MTKYDAVIKLSDKAQKQIEWFTKNFDKEIAAFGTAKMEDGIVYVEDLYFPKQTVTSTNVDIQSAQWSDIVQEVPLETLSKINFHWHKHPPGSASPSQGDETRTFDSLMGEDDTRDFFAFLITSPDNKGSYTYYGRIELRKPLWVTIENVQMTSDTNTAIEEECQKILTDKVSTATATITPLHYTPNLFNKYNGYEPEDSWENFGKPKKSSREWEVTSFNGMAKLKVPIDDKELAREVIHINCQGLVSSVSNMTSTDPAVHIFNIFPKGPLKNLITVLEETAAEVLMGNPVHPQEEFLNKGESLERQIEKIDRQVMTEIVQEMR